MLDPTLLSSCLRVFLLLTCMYFARGMRQTNSLLLCQIISVLPLAIVHTLGNLLTNVSLGQVAVSFTHTIKVSKGLQLT